MTLTNKQLSIERFRHFEWMNEKKNESYLNSAVRVSCSTMASSSVSLKGKWVSLKCSSSDEFIFVRICNRQEKKFND